MAMLGEIVVHGEDIRRPLGLKHQPPEEALVAVADSWKNSNLLIGSKRRITGLRLRATDTEWVHGDGPEVSGPLLSLILAMTGRKDVHPDLTGEGVAELRPPAVNSAGSHRARQPRRRYPDGIWAGPAGGRDDRRSGGAGGDDLPGAARGSRTAQPRRAHLVRPGARAS